MSEDLFGSGHGVPSPAKTEMAKDLGQQSLEPMSPVRSGLSLTPATLLETVSKVVTVMEA